MYRILFACVDIAVSLIFAIPIFVLCGFVFFKSVKHTVLYFVFALYLIAVFSVVGIPNVNGLKTEDLSINLVPLVGMLSDRVNTGLNVLLFVPMGLLLPILWQECRQAKRTALICFLVSLSIELLQLFTFRTTDINDLIANTAGGVLGFLIAKVFTGSFSKHVCSKTKRHEMYLVFFVSFALMFFAVPFVSDRIADRILFPVFTATK